jgi:hypothetical protein
MEFKGKYKEWYDRLVKANYGDTFAKKRIEKFMEEDDDKFWEKQVYKLIQQGANQKEAFKKIEIVRNATTNNERREIAIQKIEYNRNRDLELLDKAIPKERLKDGAWYDCDTDAKKVARFGGKAKWVKEKGMFLAPGQQQFGMNGWLDHWEDVINDGYAGFVPMWEVEN